MDTHTYTHRAIYNQDKQEIKKEAITFNAVFILWQCIEYTEKRIDHELNKMNFTLIPISKIVRLFIVKQNTELRLEPLAK